MQENPRLPSLREKAMKLPMTPGVYIMKNKSGKIIYIGKAKKLKNRVSQYFGSQQRHGTKVRKMVENVEDFDYILTDSEFEALVLECSLIKQNMPKYNILLKDDKGYSYIKVTRGEWGRISPCFRKQEDGAEYIGPYTGSFSVTAAVDRACEIFLLPSCRKEFPRDISPSKRPCLNYFIKKCSGVCAGKISKQDYEKSFNQAVDFLKGGSLRTVEELRKEMEKSAEELDFERAARLRDRIRAIERISQKQKVVVSDSVDEDVFALVQGSEKSCLAVLSFRDGLLVNSEHFIIDEVGSAEELRQQAIAYYYSMGRSIPSAVILDGEMQDMSLVADYLSEKKGKRVNLRVPQRGEKLRVMEMCMSNAAQKLGESLGRSGRQTAVLDELKRMLRLERLPEYIEAYDISHTAGSDNVAGMVVFRSGRPLKRAYKRFSIKSFSGQDDYGSMREVISRRFNRYMEERDTQEGFGKLPDLILLDGGEGQVNAVKPIIEAFGVDVPVFGMVKDSSHRTRAITADGEEISISSSRQVFTLISSIQEEVHRFAITYHKSKHTSSALETRLTAIEGIGKAKAQLLLKSFRTVAAISRAAPEELSQLKGISKRDADAIYAYFHKDK